MAKERGKVLTVKGKINSVISPRKMLYPITHLHGPKDADISVFTSGVSVTATWPFWDISPPFQTSFSYNAKTQPIFLPRRENFSCSGDLKSSFCPFCRHNALKTQTTIIQPVSSSQDFISAALHTKIKPERTQKLKSVITTFTQFYLFSKILKGTISNFLGNLKSKINIFIYKYVPNGVQIPLPIIWFILVNKEFIIFIYMGRVSPQRLPCSSAILKNYKKYRASVT